MFFGQLYRRSQESLRDLPALVSDLGDIYKPRRRALHDGRGAIGAAALAVSFLVWFTFWRFWPPCLRNPSRCAVRRYLARFCVNPAFGSKLANYCKINCARRAARRGSFFAYKKLS